jgi:hypothetical protein
MTPNCREVEWISQVRKCPPHYDGEQVFHCSALWACPVFRPLGTVAWNPVSRRAVRDARCGAADPTHRLDVGAPDLDRSPRRSIFESITQATAQVSLGPGDLLPTR